MDSVAHVAARRPDLVVLATHLARDLRAPALEPAQLVVASGLPGSDALVARELVDLDEL